jgi:hypothetical protein
MTIKMKQSLASLRDSPGPHEYNITRSSIDSASSQITIPKQKTYRLQN